LEGQISKQFANKSKENLENSKIAKCKLNIEFKISGIDGWFQVLGSGYV